MILERKNIGGVGTGTDLTLARWSGTSTLTDSAITVQDTGSIAAVFSDHTDAPPNVTGLDLTYSVWSALTGSVEYVQLKFQGANRISGNGTHTFFNMDFSPSIKISNLDTAGGGSFNYSGLTLSPTMNMGSKSTRQWEMVRAVIPSNLRTTNGSTGFLYRYGSASGTNTTFVRGFDVHIDISAATFSADEVTGFNFRAIEFSDYITLATRYYGFKFEAHNNDDGLGATLVDDIWGVASAEHIMICPDQDAKDKHLYWGADIENPFSSRLASMFWNVASSRLELQVGTVAKLHMTSALTTSINQIEIPGILGIPALVVSGHLMTQSVAVIDLDSSWTISGQKTGIKLNLSTFSGINAADRTIAMQDGGTNTFSVEPQGQVNSEIVASTSGGYTYSNLNYLANTTFTASGTSAIAWVGYNSFLSNTISNSNTHSYLGYKAKASFIISSGSPTLNYTGFQSAGLTISTVMNDTVHFHAEKGPNSGAGTAVTLKGFYADLTNVASTFSGDIDAFVADIDDGGTNKLVVTNMSVFHAKATNFTSASTAVTNFWGLKIDASTDSEITNKFGFGIAMDSLFTDDKYLYWGAAIGTALASRGAGIRWNSGGSTLDFEVGTTVEMELMTGGYGFGLAATAVQTGYATSNVSTDRVIDADSTSLDEVADVLSTLIEDLKAKGLISA